MKLFAGTIVAVLVLITLGLSGFIVYETDHAIVIRMGNPVGAISKPGLHFRVPFIDQLVWLDRRLLTSDQDPKTFTTKDKKRVKIDYLIRWKIQEPIQFYQNLKNIRNAMNKLDSLVRGLLQEEIAGRNFSDHSADSEDKSQIGEPGVIGENRKDIMTKITDQANGLALENYGIKVIDVRMKRLDLPPEVENSVFERMKAERTRIARKYRAEGAKAARRIKADAAKQVRIIKAQAYERSQELKGEGEAEASRIYAEAFERGAEFYSFFRRLETYETIFADRTSIVLDQGTPLLRTLADPSAVPEIGSEAKSP